MAKPTFYKSQSKTPAGAKKYYYAGGERVDLTPADDLIAIDDDSLKQVGITGIPAGAMRQLSNKVRLVERLGIKGLDISPDTGVLTSRYPVFRSHGVLMVALPEVRVEESRKPEMERVGKWLHQHGISTVIESQDDGRLVLKLESGSDALDLANALTEQVGPEMAQVRFLRVTPRPKSTEEG